eukprot:15477897-Alexandrium_andersonii.AAC.1
MDREERRLQALNRVMTGRRSLWHIGTWFQTKEDCGDVYLLTDLSSIRLPQDANDAQLKAFYDTWMRVFHGQKET